MEVVDLLTARSLVTMRAEPNEHSTGPGRHDGRKGSPHEGAPRVEFSASGDRVALVFQDRQVSLWSVLEARQIAALPGDETVLALRFSPDGRTLLVSREGARVSLLDSETGRVDATLDGHLADVTFAAFTPDSARVVTSGDDSTKLWRVATGELLTTFAEARAVAVSRDGAELAANGPMGLQLWTIDPGRLLARGCEALAGRPEATEVAPACSDS